MVWVRKRYIPSGNQLAHDFQPIQDPNAPQGGFSGEKIHNSEGHGGGPPLGAVFEITIFTKTLTLPNRSKIHEFSVVSAKTLLINHQKLCALRIFHHPPVILSSVKLGYAPKTLENHGFERCVQLCGKCVRGVVRR